MANKEALDRHELPVQSIYPGNEDVVAIAPVHLSIFGLPPELRIDPHIVPQLQDVVATTFNEDMDYYIEMLRDSGGSSEWPWLKGYEKFSDEWSLHGTENGNGFLELHWTEKEGTQSIGLVEVPTILYNQVGENGKFYSPQSALHGVNIEIMYRPLRHPDVIWMTPEKMKQYGTETPQASIDIPHGVARVEGRTFRSGYYENMAKALLLRDFSVAYLNGLLDASPDA